MKSILIQTSVQFIPKNAIAETPIDATLVATDWHPAKINWLNFTVIYGDVNIVIMTKFSSQAAQKVIKMIFCGTFFEDLWWIPVRQGQWLTPKLQNQIAVLVVNYGISNTIVLEIP